VALYLLDGSTLVLVVAEHPEGNIVTILSYSSTHPGQLELQGVYGRLEGRAAWLMGDGET